MAAVHLKVRGKVQGVGFRAFVQRTALTFRVNGEVWNAADGSVEVFAQHDDAKHLEAFERILYDGPGRIESIERQESGEREVSSFAVGPSR